MSTKFENNDLSIKSMLCAKAGKARKNRKSKPMQKQNVQYLNATVSRGGTMPQKEQRLCFQIKAGVTQPRNINAASTPLNKSTDNSSSAQ